MRAVPTTPDHRSAAAWGDPAIIARCGLDPLAPTTELRHRRRGRLGRAPAHRRVALPTTYGRDPAIEVLVPQGYGAVPLLLPAFAGRVSRSLPGDGRHCS